VNDQVSHPYKTTILSALTVCKLHCIITGSN
jgi:hypothetical protein